MSSKKKLVISLSVAATVLVAAIIAIVAVFAAANQAIQSSVGVTFRARNVDCSVNATYTTNTKTTPVTIKEFSILASDAGSTAHRADLANVNLQEGGTSGVFITLSYEITNNSSRDMVVRLTGLQDNTGNWEITYSHDDLTGGGVTIAGKTTDKTSSETFTVTIKATAQALKSAEDITMNTVLDWSLTAKEFEEPAQPEV